MVWEDGGGDPASYPILLEGLMGGGWNGAEGQGNPGQGLLTETLEISNID